ncbi:MAG: septal ring lytic transglycosylase RlpA family protein [Pseudomonadota bacterium]
MNRPASGQGGVAASTAGCAGADASRCRGRFGTVFIVLVTSALLAACGGIATRSSDGPPAESGGYVPDAVPKAEAKSRYGNPKSYVVFGKRYYTLDSAVGFTERGIASWYGTKFHGRRTSSGETYDMHAMTAAHKRLPLPSYVEVTNLNNGRKITVRVNDRGPFVAGRVIDLSHAAATRLDMIRAGTAPVAIRAITPGQQAAPSTPPAPAASALTGAVFVQAGAFAASSNARIRSDEVARVTGHPIQVREQVRTGRRLHVVRVGPFDDAAAAELVRADLARSGIDDARVVIIE